MRLDRPPIALILSDLFSRPIGALLSRCVGVLCASFAPSARPRSLRRIGPFQPVSGLTTYYLYLSIIGLLGCTEAAAYPQFQFSTGNSRCGDCHYSPSGGGLLNTYGRSESADTISRGGNGDFLYGAYKEPDWVKLGVDLRVAGLVKDQAAEPEYLAFPMLGDTYVYFQSGAWSLYTAFGPRAQARSQRKSVIKRFGSREHYVMWRPNTHDWYVRVGRFHAPYGLRPPDHTWYVRRELNFYTFDETYNVSVGKTGNGSELHLTGFTSLAAKFTQAGSANESGFAAYYEHDVISETAAIAGQARIAFSGDDANYFIGAVGKYYIENPRILVLAELDLGLQTFAASPGPSRAKLISYIGATWFPFTGLMLTAAHEHYDEDLSVGGLARDGLSLSVQLFPRAKWEIITIGKLEFHGSRHRRSTLAMLQLHYYL